MHKLWSLAMDHRLVISIEATLQALDDVLLPEIHHGAGQYVFDLSKVPPTTAPNAVNLLLLLGYVGNVSQMRPILILPNNPAVVSFLCNVRFFVLAESLCEIRKFMPLPEPVSSAVMAKRNILEIKHIRAQETSQVFHDRLSYILLNSIIGKLDKLGTNSFVNLSSVYVELCKNIFEHSGSFGYAGAQILKENSVLQITIGDLGVGIFKTLNPYYLSDIEEFNRRYGPVWNEMKALDIAFAPGVSVKRIHNKVEGGAGLYSVLATVRQSKGNLICRTGTNKIFLGYRHNEWTTLIKQDLLFFPGTQLEVYIPLDRMAKRE